MKKYITCYESGSFIISKEKKLICVGNNDLVYNIKDPGVATQEVDLEKICKIGGLKKDNFIVESLTESFTALIIKGYTFKFNLIQYKILLQLEYEFERHPHCQKFRAFFRQNFPEIRDSEYPYFIKTSLDETRSFGTFTETQSDSESSRIHLQKKNTSQFKFSNHSSHNHLKVPGQPEKGSIVELNLIGKIQTCN
jgi:hypothetical protein